MLPNSKDLLKKKGKICTRRGGLGQDPLKKNKEK